MAGRGGYNKQSGRGGYNKNILAGRGGYNRLPAVQGRGGYNRGDEGKGDDTGRGGYNWVVRLLEFRSFCNNATKTHIRFFLGFASIFSP